MAQPNYSKLRETVVENNAFRIKRAILISFMWHLLSGVLFFLPAILQNVVGLDILCNKSWEWQYSAVLPMYDIKTNTPVWIVIPSVRVFIFHRRYLMISDGNTVMLPQSSHIDSVGSLTCHLYCSMQSCMNRFFVFVTLSISYNSHDLAEVDYNTVTQWQTLT